MPNFWVWLYDLVYYYCPQYSHILEDFLQKRDYLLTLHYQPYLKVVCFPVPTFTLYYSCFWPKSLNSYPLVCSLLIKDTCHPYLVVVVETELPMLVVFEWVKFEFMDNVDYDILSSNFKVTRSWTKGAQSEEYERKDKVKAVGESFGQTKQNLTASTTVKNTCLPFLIW
jgi:hypothetical protein